MTIAEATRPATGARLMSGMRPTGRLHIGHLVGALTNWAELSRTTDAFFEVADLHAFTTGFEDPQAIRANREDVVLDWIAAGIDPARCTMFLQSAVPEISELHAILSMITPVAWLQRVPTYKDQIEALGPEIATYGFLGYPLLQLCDIAVFRANLVPVGKDQMSHLEFGREVVRRFNHLYGANGPGRPPLVEPEGLLSEFPALLGSDGRKMSKSCTTRSTSPTTSRPPRRKSARSSPTRRRCAATTRAGPRSAPSSRCTTSRTRSACR